MLYYCQTLFESVETNHQIFHHNILLMTVFRRSPFQPNQLDSKAQCPKYLEDFQCRLIMTPIATEPIFECDERHDECSHNYEASHRLRLQHRSELDFWWKIAGVGSSSKYNFTLLLILWRLYETSLIVESFIGNSFIAGPRIFSLKCILWSEKKCKGSKMGARTELPAF